MLSGVNVALLTPEGQNGIIDIDSGLKLVNSLVQAGVDGLFLLGTNGEGIRFCVDERIRFARAILEHTDRSKVKICVHTGASSVGDTVALSMAAYRDRADCVAVVTPYMLCYDQKQLYEYYKSVSDALPMDLPIYLYNIPQRTGNDISAELLQRLKSDCNNIVGIKYSFEDLNRTMEYLAVPDCVVLHGSDIHQMQFLSMGCNGIISGLAGVFPTPFCKVRDAWSKGDIATAQKWQKICYEVGKLLYFGDISVMKEALKFKGFSFVTPRRFSENELLTFQQRVAAIEQLIAQNI